MLSHDDISVPQARLGPFHWISLGAVAGTVVFVVRVVFALRDVGSSLSHVRWLTARDVALECVLTGTAIGLLFGLAQLPRTRVGRGLARGGAGIVTALAVAGVGVSDRIRHMWLGFDGPDGMGSVSLAYIWWKLEAYRGPIVIAALVGAVALVGLVWWGRHLVRSALPPTNQPRPRFAATALIPAGAALLMVAGLAVVTAARWGTLPAAAAGAPNVIFLSIDTLRADRLGAYGNRRGLTPNLDRFADGARLFESGFSQAPWTLTSHMSMLTSLYPSVHGVDEGIALNPRVVTLAEAFRNAGYDTRAVVRTVPWMEPKYGFDDGFQRYVIKNFTLDGAVQNQVVAREVDTLGGRPFFLFLHYFDVHSDFHRLPYDAPAPFYEQFAEPHETDFPGGYDGMFASDYLKHLNRTRAPMPEADLAYVSATYDAGLAYMDRCFGDLLALLDERVDLDNTWFVITADHGEEFREHGYMLHSDPRHHRELVHVPFLIRGPGVEPGRSSRLVEVLDLAPTLLDVVGAAPVDGMQGVSLADHLRGGDSSSDPAKRYVYSELGPSVSITSPDFRLLVRPDLDVPFALFDRRRDPFELHNVVTEYPEVASRMMAALNERRREETSLGGGKVTLSESESDMLKSLGYLE